MSTLTTTTICRCSVPGCTHNSRNSNYSFFRFPKDIERARAWSVACRRDDLLDKLDKLHNSSYRVCGVHFRREMFASDLKNRLQRTAVPSLFACFQTQDTPAKPAPAAQQQQQQQIFASGTTIYILQPSAPGQTVRYATAIPQQQQHQLLRPGLITYKAAAARPQQLLPNLNLQQTTTNSTVNEEKPLEQPVVQMADDVIIKEEHNIEDEEMTTPPTSPIRNEETKSSTEFQTIQTAEETEETTTIRLIVKEEPPSPGPLEITLPPYLDMQIPQQQEESETVSKCDRQVQTSKELPMHLPRVVKLKRNIKFLENQNFFLKQRLKKLQNSDRKNAFIGKITFDDYKKLTYAMCPSKKIAEAAIDSIAHARHVAEMMKENNTEQ